MYLNQVCGKIIQNRLLFSGHDFKAVWQNIDLQTPTYHNRFTTQQPSMTSAFVCDLLKLFHLKKIIKIALNEQFTAFMKYIQHN